MLSFLAVLHTCQPPPFSRETPVCHYPLPISSRFHVSPVFLPNYLYVTKPGNGTACISPSTPGTSCDSKRALLSVSQLEKSLIKEEKAVGFSSCSMGRLPHWFLHWAWASQWREKTVTTGRMTNMGSLWVFWFPPPSKTCMLGHVQSVPLTAVQAKVWSWSLSAALWLPTAAHRITVHVTNKVSLSSP